MKFRLLQGLILFSPLAFGSSPEPIATLFFLILVLWTAMVWNDAREPIGIPGGKWLERLVLALPLLALVQLIPLPRGIVESLHPGALPLLESLPHQAGEWLYLSLAPGVTWNAALRLLALALFFLTLARLSLKRKEVRGLAGALLLSGSLQALIGAARILLPGRDFFLIFHRVENTAPWNNLTGTFAESGQAALLMAMALLTGVGIWSAEAGIFSSRKAGTSGLREWLAPGEISIIVIGMVALNLAGFIMAANGNMGWLLAAVSGVWLIFWLYSLFPPQRRCEWRWVLPVVAVIAVFMGIRNTKPEFRNRETGERVWVNPERAIRKMIKAYPVLGTGWGTFVLTNPDYLKRPDIQISHARHEWLQICVEAGAVSLAFLGGALLLFFLGVWRRWIQCGDRWIRGVSLGLLAGAALTWIFSFTNYPLRIPSLAFLTLMLMAVAVSLLAKQHTRTFRKPSRALSAVLLVVTSVGLTARLLGDLAPIMDGGSLRSRNVAAILDPINPESHRKLGEARLDMHDISGGIADLRKSLRYNPMAPETWMFLAGAHLGDPGQRRNHFELGIEELRTAARFGPGRRQLSLALGLELLRLWPLLDERQQMECRMRLTRGIKHMSQDQIDAMIHDWYLYSRSWDLMAAVIERRPEICESTANKLLQLGAPLEWRWRLLAGEERRQYARVREMYSQGEHRTLADHELEEMLRRMERIRGYAGLLDPEDMDGIRFRYFRDELVLETLERALRRFRRNPDDRNHGRVMDCLDRLVSRPRKLDVADLPRRLDESGVWREGDSDQEIMRIRLAIMMGDYAAVMERARMQSRVMDPEAAVRASLLGARAAMAVRLMASARELVSAALARDPGNLEALWQKVRIHLFLREAVDNADLARLREAALLKVSSGSARGFLPLIEGVRAGIRVPPGPMGKKRLIQVLVDGVMHLEKYQDEKETILWLDLPLPGDLDPMPSLSVEVLIVDPHG